MAELTAAQLACVRRILAARLPGREVRMFGSRVTGKAKPYSDLDLVVMDAIGFVEQAVREGGAFRMENQHKTTDVEVS